MKTWHPVQLKPEDKEAPLPSTLEEALAEVVTLRRILRREREQLAKVVVKRAQDNRAAAGNLKTLRDEITRLKTEGSPGVMHAADQAFYDLTVRQRDLAWRENDALQVELQAARKRNY